MPEYKESCDDYALKYNECIVSYKKNPVKVRGFSKNEGNVILKGTELIKSDDVSIKIDDNDLDISCLNRGAVNLSSTVVVYTTKKAIDGSNKYKRAIHPGNTQIVDPFKAERKLLNSQPARFNDPLLFKAWINNKYYSAQDALDSVMSLDRIATAFTPDYYFGIKYSTDAVMLFRGIFMIGRVNPQNGEILLKPGAHPYAEELEEMGLTVKKVAK